MFVCRECQPLEHGPGLSPRALEFLRTVATVSPERLCDVALPPTAERELAMAHQILITTHLGKELKSMRVLRALGAQASDDPISEDEPR